MAGCSIRHLAAFLVAGLAVLGGSPVCRADESVAEQTRDIRFNLPGEAGARAAVILGDREVTLELPHGADLPMEIAASGQELFESVKLTEPSPDETRIVLVLSQSELDRVLYEPGAVILRFRTKAAGAPHLDERQYRLGPDDKILIIVDGHPDLARQTVVRRNGRVAAPLVGEVQAAGLTAQQLGVRLQGLLTENYLVDPHVNVEVVEHNSQWAVVSGAVRLPGRVALKGGTLLTEVIADAGGLTEEAGQEIIISKGQTTGEEGDLYIARRDFERGTVNPVLEHGDLVNVASVSYCYVHGEVRQPGQVEIEPGMTLLRALSMVGGLTEWANRKEVKIIQEGEQGRGSLHNIKRIQAMKEPDPKLIGGEVIIVPRRFL